MAKRIMVMLLIVGGCQPVWRIGHSLALPLAPGTRSVFKSISREDVGSRFGAGVGSTVRVGLASTEAPTAVSRVLVRQQQLSSPFLLPEKASDSSQDSASIGLSLRALPRHFTALRAQKRPIIKYRMQN